jgi:hypothetical protein
VQVKPPRSTAVMLLHGREHTAPSKLSSVRTTDVEVDVISRRARIRTATDSKTGIVLPYTGE